jgi:oligoendopeptidase F
MREVANKFFANNWIDAQVKSEKSNGAFCAPTTANIHPYVLVNYSQDLRSVQTLAHELGHGIHQYLAGKNQNFLQMNTPLTTAETASVFGEMLTFENLYRDLDDNKEKLFLLAKKIDDMIGTVFFQISLNRFENSIHKARREGGELTTDQFNTLWRDSQEDMYGEAVELREGYDCWWSYIPHFIKAPGYVYAYAFGQLLVLALYDKYKHSENNFSQQYIEVLKAGGSDWPDEIMSNLGVDIAEPEFWLHGIEIIEEMISKAEDLAEKVETN